MQMCMSLQVNMKMGGVVEGVFLPRAWGLQGTCFVNNRSIYNMPP